MFCRAFGTTGWHQANVAALANAGHELFALEWAGRSVPFVVQEMQHEESTFRVGRFATIETSDYLDFDGIETVNARFFEALSTRASEHNVDALLLSNVVRNNHFHQTAAQIFERMAALDCVSTLGITCPPNATEAYHQGLGKSTGRNLLKISSNCTDRGCEFHLEPLTQQQLRWLLHHQEARAAAMAYDVLDNTLVKEVLSTQLPTERIQFASISFNNKTIAGMIMLVAPTSMAVYIQAFDAEYQRWYPSLFLLAKLAEHASATGCEYIDLLRGEEAYKERYCNHKIELTKLLIDTSKTRSWNALTALSKSLIE